MAEQSPKKPEQSSTTKKQEQEAFIKKAQEEVLQGFEKEAQRIEAEMQQKQEQKPEQRREDGASKKTSEQKKPKRNASASRSRHSAQRRASKKTAQQKSSSQETWAQASKKRAKEVKRTQQREQQKEQREERTRAQQARRAVHDVFSDQLINQYSGDDMAKHQWCERERATLTTLLQKRLKEEGENFGYERMRTLVRTWLQNGAIYSKLKDYLPQGDLPPADHRSRLQEDMAENSAQTIDDDPDEEMMMQRSLQKRKEQSESEEHEDEEHTEEAKENLSQELQEAVRALEEARAQYVKHDLAMDRASSLVQRLVGKKHRPEEGAVYDDYLASKKRYDDALQSYAKHLLHDKEFADIDPEERAQIIDDYLRIGEVCALEHARLEQNPVYNKVRDIVHEKITMYRKLSWKKKLLISGALLGGSSFAVGSGAVVGGVLGGAVWLSRTLGLSALYSGKMDVLEQEALKDTITHATIAQKHFEQGAELSEKSIEEKVEAFLQASAQETEERFQEHKDAMVARRYSAAIATGKWAAIFSMGGYLLGEYLHGDTPSSHTTTELHPSQTPQAPVAETAPVEPSPVLQSDVNYDGDAIAPRMEDPSLSTDGEDVVSPSTTTPYDTLLSPEQQQHLKDIEAFNTFDINHHDAVGSSTPLSPTPETVVEAPPVEETVNETPFPYDNIEPHGDLAGVLRIPEGGSVEKSLQEFLVANHEKLRDGALGWDPQQYHSVQEWAGVRAHVLAQEFFRAHPEAHIDLVQPGTVIEVDISDPADLHIAVHEDGNAFMEETTTPHADTSSASVTEHAPVPEQGEMPTPAPDETLNFLQGLSETQREAFLRSVGSTMRNTFETETLQSSTMFGTGTADNFHYNPQALRSVPVRDLLSTRDAQWYGEQQAQNMERFITKAQHLLGEQQARPTNRESVEAYFTRIGALAYNHSDIFEKLFRKPL